jgi:hypothetical protein
MEWSAEHLPAFESSQPEAMMRPAFFAFFTHRESLPKLIRFHYTSPPTHLGQT